MSMEMLELALMRTFIALSMVHYRSHCKTHEAIPAAYSALAAVCCNWRQTMNGWPESTTRHWFRHRLHHKIKCKNLCGSGDVLQISKDVVNIIG